MNSIAQKRRYLPHELTTKIHAVETYRQTRDIGYVCRKYHVSKSSLMRWNRRYDGTKETLANKSHRPLSLHPRAHTESELKWISDLHRRNPNISLCEMYGKLLAKGYTRHPGSLYRVFVRLGYRIQAVSTKKLSKHLGKYETPTQLGGKWQMDVKYVPVACNVSAEKEQHFQYTMLEEASRLRFIRAYREQSGYSTVDFVRRAIAFIGYKPEVIQTDNGGEFTNFRKTKRVHAFDLFCQKNHIVHKLIRPRTPWHNGKVERSHRNDQERFYNHLRYFSFEDLQKQMRSYLVRANRIPMACLGWQSPLQKHFSLLAECQKTN